MLTCNRPQQFRTEFYMDRHMDNKHADKLIMGDDSSPRCLESLCGVLGCGDYATEGCVTTSVSEGAGGSVGGGMMGCGACDNADMDRRRFRCKALFHRSVFSGIQRQRRQGHRAHYLTSLTLEGRFNKTINYY